MNERDSEAVAAQLVAKGYSLAKSEATADVVLLNTCSVRDFAEQKAINKMENIVGTARSQKREQIVGFMGCMAQSRGQELIDKLPDVDLVLGTQKFHRAAEYLDELLAGKRDKNRGRCRRGQKRGDHPRTSAQRQRQDFRVRVRQHHAGLQPILHFLHRALHARRGTQPHDSRHRRRMPRTCFARRAGNHLARPDRHELRQTRLSRYTTANPLSSNCSMPFTKLKDWNASASPRRIRKVTAMIWSRLTRGCRSCARARTSRCKAAATAF